MADKAMLQQFIAVVRRHDDQRILAQPQFVELHQHFPDFGVLLPERLRVQGADGLGVAGLVKFDFALADNQILSDDVNLRIVQHGRINIFQKQPIIGRRRIIWQMRRMKMHPREKRLIFVFLQPRQQVGFFGTAF